jgi:hypothetical protein
MRFFMNVVQLDFFKTEDECQIDALRKGFADVKSSSDKVRKKLFAENGKLTKQILDLQERVEILERGVCQQRTRNV